MFFIDAFMFKQVKLDQDPLLLCTQKIESVQFIANDYTAVIKCAQSEYFNTYQVSNNPFLSLIISHSIGLIVTTVGTTANIWCLLVYLKLSRRENSTKPLYHSLSISRSSLTLSGVRTSDYDRGYIVHFFL